MFINSGASNVEHSHRASTPLCANCVNSTDFANGSAKFHEPNKLYEIQIACENSAWRIHEDGPGAEIVRRIAVKRLRGLINLMYAHGRIADIVILGDALEKTECRQGSAGTASLVESFLSILGIDPLEVLAKP
jgi:hypothetical protein